MMSKVEKLTDGEQLKAQLETLKKDADVLQKLLIVPKLDQVAVRQKLDQIVTDEMASLALRKEISDLMLAIFKSPAARGLEDAQREALWMWDNQIKGKLQRYENAERGVWLGIFRILRERFPDPDRRPLFPPDERDEILTAFLHTLFPCTPPISGVLFITSLPPPESRPRSRQRQSERKTALPLRSFSGEGRDPKVSS